MQISHSSLQLSSSNVRQTQVSVEESLLAGQVRQGESFNPDNLVNGIAFEHRGQSRQLSLDTYAHLASSRAEPRDTSPSPVVGKVTPAAPEEPELSSEDRLKIDLIQRIYQRLTGKELKFSLTLYQPGQPPAATGSGDTTAVPNQESSLESGLIYRYRETREISEQVAFTASGQIRTTDGRSIDISLELNMQRELSETLNFELRAGAALKDPLVVNFNGTSAELESDTFSFDLDYDGTSDTLHRLSSHSGYLALDRNGNGQVDDGSELFGVRSGNGFADLAAYDEDNNGFIDEADAIWQQLGIWTQTAAGENQLQSLSERNVSALYLGYSATSWQLGAGDNNQLAGAISASGLWLSESGEAGTLQQVDLVV